MTDSFDPRLARLLQLQARDGDHRLERRGAARELIGGQPTINLYEVQCNPLGPLQSWGDQMLQAVH